MKKRVTVWYDDTCDNIVFTTKIDDNNLLMRSPVWALNYISFSLDVIGHDQTKGWVRLGNL